MRMRDSGARAGPAATPPVVTLNLEPWQGQLMVPWPTLLTRHCMWVQTALKAWKSPAVGWVTTTRASVKTLPPPTGMSVVLPSTVPPPELALGLGSILGSALAAAGAGPVAALLRSAQAVAVVA